MAPAWAVLNLGWSSSGLGEAAGLGVRVVGYPQVEEGEVGQTGSQGLVRTRAKVNPKGPRCSHQGGPETAGKDTCS